jgi:hypothetical protein
MWRQVDSAAYSFVRFSGAAAAPWLAGVLGEQVNVHLPFWVGAAARTTNSTRSPSTPKSQDRIDEGANDIGGRDGDTAEQQLPQRRPPNRPAGEPGRYSAGDHQADAAADQSGP